MASCTRHHPRRHCQLSGPRAPFSGPARLERGSTIGEQRSSPTPSCRATDTSSIPWPLKLTMPCSCLRCRRLSGIRTPDGDPIVLALPRAGFLPPPREIDAFPG